MSWISSFDSSVGSWSAVPRWSPDDSSGPNPHSSANTATEETAARNVAVRSCRNIMVFSWRMAGAKPAWGG